MIPAITIQICAYSAGPKDAHGNAVESWGQGQDVLVYAVAPSESDEPTPRRSLVATDFMVYAPMGVRPSPRDRVIWDGQTYEVIGETSVWSSGPFGWAPGTSFRIRRKEG